MYSDVLFVDKSGTPARAVASDPSRELSDRIREAFAQHARPFHDGAVILIENDECHSVFCALEGWLSLSKSLDEGQTQIIDFALPGDIVDPAAADGATSSVTIEALTEGSLAEMPYANWERMTAEWPELHRHEHRLKGADQARRAERMLRLGKGTAEMRVAYALLEFCIRLGTVCDSGTPEFHIPLTQQQLGDFIGLSSVHVCRTMRRMVRNGIVEMSDHMNIKVLDGHALAQLAAVDRRALKGEILPARA